MIDALNVISHLPAIFTGIFLGLGVILLTVLEIKKKVVELTEKISSANAEPATRGRIF